MRGCAGSFPIRKAAVSPPPSPVTDGSVLVRVPAHDRGWVRALPATPDGEVLTVTVGHAELLPVPSDDLAAHGYRIVGVASAHRPVGPVVDVLVPLALRIRQPDWWAVLLGMAERVFDLRLGPVQQVLAGELALHSRAAAS